MEEKSVPPGWLAGWLSDTCLRLKKPPLLSVRQEFSQQKMESGGGEKERKFPANDALVDAGGVVRL